MTKMRLWLILAACLVLPSLGTGDAVAQGVPWTPKDECSLRLEGVLDQWVRTAETWAATAERWTGTWIADPNDAAWKAVISGWRAGLGVWVVDASFSAPATERWMLDGEFWKALDGQWAPGKGNNWTWVTAPWQAQNGVYGSAREAWQAITTLRDATQFDWIAKTERWEMNAIRWAEAGGGSWEPTPPGWTPSAELPWSAQSSALLSWNTAAEVWKVGDDLWTFSGRHWDTLGLVWTVSQKDWGVKDKQWVHIAHKWRAPSPPTTESWMALREEWRGDARVWIGLTLDWKAPVDKWQGLKFDWHATALKWELASMPWSTTAALDGAWEGALKSWKGTAITWGGAQMLWSAPAATAASEAVCPSDVALAAE